VAYGIDEKLNDGLQLHGVSVEQFAKLATLFGIPKTSRAKLYEAFRGVRALDNETALKLWKLWERVLDIVERAQPFKLDLDDAERVKMILDLDAMGVHIFAATSAVKNSSSDETTVPVANPLVGDAANNSETVDDDRAGIS